MFWVCVLLTESTVSAAPCLRSLELWFPFLRRFFYLSKYNLQSTIAQLLTLVKCLGLLLWDPPQMSTERVLSIWNIGALLGHPWDVRVLSWSLFHNDAVISRCCGSTA